MEGYMAKRVRVTTESESGRNQRFYDPERNRNMTRPEFVKDIRDGKYAGDYHVRNVNGVPTPASNPDKSGGNNLG
jgi:hypothetical protein